MDKDLDQTKLVDPHSDSSDSVKSWNDNSNPQQGAGAVTPNKSMTGNHAIAAKPEDWFGSSPTLKIPPNKKDDRKLFVGGLPVDITEDEFRSFFGRFGTLIDGVVMVDRETCRSRGFGFVSFEDPSVAKKLLKMGCEDSGSLEIGRLMMRGKTIEVKAAQPRDGMLPNLKRHHTQPRLGRRNQNMGFHSVIHNNSPGTVAPYGFASDFANAFYNPFVENQGESIYTMCYHYDYYQHVSSGKTNVNGMVYSVSCTPYYGATNYVYYPKCTAAAAAATSTTTTSTASSGFLESRSKTSSTTIATQGVLESRIDDTSIALQTDASKANVAATFL